MSNDAVDHEHASFYFNVPNEVSTPPRRRRATISALKFSRESEQSHLVGLGAKQSTDVNMEDYLSLSVPSSPRPVLRSDVERDAGTARAVRALGDDDGGDRLMCGARRAP